MRCIREIERLRPELCVEPFRDPERPVNAEVQIPGAGPAQGIITRSPEARASHRRIGQRIEPGLRVAENLDLRLDLVRPLIRASRHVQRVAGRDGKRRTGVQDE